MTNDELYEWLEASKWDRIYWSRVFWRAKALDSDGCTKVADYLIYTCHEHDFFYRRHTYLWGAPITRREADLAYRVRIQQASAFAGMRIPWVFDSLGFLSPISWWRWGGVRFFGGSAWEQKISVEEERKGGLMITLCGSRQFAPQFQEQYDRLTKAGHIVLSFNYSDEDAGELLDPLQQRRIDVSDEIFVINVGGLIDEQTRAEIQYARTVGVPARYLEPVEPEAV